MERRRVQDDGIRIVNCFSVGRIPHLLVLKMKHMYYVYILRSLKDSRFYIGSTHDLKKRFAQHNHGEAGYTQKYMPWELIYYEAYTRRNLAENRERKLKNHGKGFTELKKRIIED